MNHIYLASIADLAFWFGSNEYYQQGSIRASKCEIGQALNFKSDSSGKLNVIIKRDRKRCDILRPLNQAHSLLGSMGKEVRVNRADIPIRALKASLTRNVIRGFCKSVSRLRISLFSVSSQILPLIAIFTIRLKSSRRLSPQMENARLFSYSKLKLSAQAKSEFERKMRGNHWTEWKPQDSARSARWEYFGEHLA